ncbi:LETM1 domain-containing protein 1 [Tachypleus tridentatus]|uniref:LETM1 domain-containing protein 1 n=1 Tax=Tachypleus tridentatus TaxID=6853 RepID=UPI003FD2442A
MALSVLKGQIPKLSRKYNALYFSQRLSGNVETPQPGSRYVKPLLGIKKYIAQKYSAFVEGYEQILQKNFPSAFRIYQIFSIGTKDLLTDMKEYLLISHELRHGKSVRDLTRKELETYFQTPKDMKKVAPMLIIAALPFTNYIILPLVIWFPRYVLSTHFWTIQQRVDFALQRHKKKLYNYRPVFRHLQSKVLTASDDNLRNRCAAILSQIGSGVHPRVDEILKIKSLFVDDPYGLWTLKDNHMHSLCRMHGLSTLPGKRYRLWSHAGFVREMDLAIIREGLSNMKLDELRWACFLRGLSPLGLPKSEMIMWLEQWTYIAKNIDNRSLSLLLHCPILLAYNFHSNWVLIH